MLTPKQLKMLRAEPFTGPSKIRLAMKLAGLTQVQVAEVIGISQSQISEDVCGKFYEISLDKSRAYARLFGCTVDDLFPSDERVAS